MVKQLNFTTRMRDCLYAENLRENDVWHLNQQNASTPAYKNEWHKRIICFSKNELDRVWGHIHEIYSFSILPLFYYHQNSVQAKIGWTKLELRDNSWLDRAFGKTPVMRKCWHILFIISKESPNKFSYKTKILARSDVVLRNKRKNSEESDRSDTHIPTSFSILIISRKRFNALSRVISQMIENCFFLQIKYLWLSYMLLIIL
jgi:hypothetical protein